VSNKLLKALEEKDQSKRVLEQISKDLGKALVRNEIPFPKGLDDDTLAIVRQALVDYLSVLKEREAGIKIKEKKVEDELLLAVDRRAQLDGILKEIKWQTKTS
jgi:hypothetical protein